MPSEFVINDAAEFEEAKREGVLDTTGALVPENCIFVMGDNRRDNASNDSRAWAGIGVNNGPDYKLTGTKSSHLCVSRRNVHGRVVARLLPPWEYSDEKPFLPK